MTGEPIFVDSSVFLSFFIDGVDTFKDLKESELITSINVAEEVAYVLIKEKAKNISRIEKHYELLKYLRGNPSFIKNISKEVISDIVTVIEEYDIKVLSPAPHLLMFKIVEDYGLLPNDALIAATCKYYGIKRIATLDEDFNRIDFLEVVEIG